MTEPRFLPIITVVNCIGVLRVHGATVLRCPYAWGKPLNLIQVMLA